MLTLSKISERGATLAGYALVLSAFTAMSLGAIEGLNSASTTYLTETSDDIAASRELAFYDELEEIPDPEGDGGDTDVDDEGEPDFELTDGGQFASVADPSACVTLESDGKLRQRACDGSPEQQISVFTNPETGSAQLRIGGECIGLENNISTTDAYEIGPCDDDNANQLFRRNEATQAWESANNRSPVMCMDIHGGDGDGHVIQQYECHGGTNQQWTDPSPYVPPVIDPPVPTVSGEATYVGTIPDGSDLSPNGSFESNDEVFVFSESVVILDSDLDVGTATIPAGTTVCSYIVWYAPEANNDVVASIDFGAPILGGSLEPSDLQATDAFALPGVTYDYSRRWESDDEFNVSGNTLDITPYAVTNNADMLRVFTDCGPTGP